jgi:group I intron endonuclease
VPRLPRHKVAGVYAIRNLRDGKVYVGSSIDLAHRRQAHWKLLAGNKHHCIHLQRAWNRDGEAGFEWVVLAECTQGECRNLEQVYLDRMAGEPNCYNVALDARCPSMTPEVKQKIGRAHKGRPRSTEYREKIASALRGKPAVCSPEGALRRVEATKKAWTGKKHSPAARSKMSAAKKGKPKPDGWSERMHAAKRLRRQAHDDKQGRLELG